MGIVFRITTYEKDAKIWVPLNGFFGKSDYIPIIAWSRNARFCSNLPVGTHLRIYGRIQSREYQKKVEEDFITKTAYEVSVYKLEIPEEE